MELVALYFSRASSHGQPSPKCKPLCGLLRCCYVRLKHPIGARCTRRAPTVRAIDLLAFLCSGILPTYLADCENLPTALMNTLLYFHNISSKMTA